MNATDTRTVRTETPRLLKVGGANLDDPRFLDALLARVRSLRKEGPVVLVHGGGKQIGLLQDALGVRREKRNGLRATSSEGMHIVTMVLCGLVNKRVVSHFVHHGMCAIGVSGADGGLLRAPFHGKGELGRVGGPPRVDTALLEQLLAEADVVVLSPVSLGPDGGLLNVNADTVAQAVAVALEADALEFVTDVDAVRDGEDELHELTIPDVRELIRDEIVHGGMRPKMEAAMAAIGSGVTRVRVGSLESLQGGRATEVHA